MARMDEASAQMSGNTKVNHIRMLTFCFINSYMINDCFSVVIHDKTSPYLLLDTFRLIRMEITKANCILKLPEGRLY